MSDSEAGRFEFDASNVPKSTPKKLLLLHIYQPLLLITLEKEHVFQLLSNSGSPLHFRASVCMANRPVL